MQTGQHIYLSYLSTGEKTRHSWDFYHLGFALDLGILILGGWGAGVRERGHWAPPISGDHCAALAPVRDNVSAVVTPPPPPPRLGHLDNGALALITGTLWHWQQSSPVNTPSFVANTITWIVSRQINNMVAWQQIQILKNYSFFKRNIRSNRV